LSVDPQTNEWNLLDQFRALVRDESMRDESIENSLILKSAAVLARP
jgi:hypothetical protein